VGLCFGDGVGLEMGRSGRALRDAHLRRDKTAPKMGHPTFVVGWGFVVRLEFFGGWGLLVDRYFAGFVEEVVAVAGSGPVFGVLD
jgi:hypothetical protein